MHDPAFASAGHAFAALVHRVPPDAWDGPGLGDDWDLRSLVGHTSRSLLTVEAYLRRPATQVDVPSPAAYLAGIGRFAGTPVDRAAVAARGREAGRALGDDPAAFVDALAARVIALVEAVPDDPVIETIAGGMRLSDYLPTRTFELVVHGRDIARVIGVEAGYDAELVEQAAVLATRAAAARGETPALLDALTGRGTLPDSFGRL